MTTNIFTDPGCWAFILNRIVIETDLPFELAPNCFIDKATEEQRRLIKEVLNDRGGGFHGPADFYECEPVDDHVRGGVSIEPLPEQEWRYYVVATPDNGITNLSLHYSSNISDVPLEISALYFFKAGGRGVRLGIVQNYFESFPLTPARHVGEVELRDISNVYRSVTEVFGERGLDNPAYPELSRAMNMYDSLSFLRKNSEFHVLGLFAIIEMLITHNPKLEDRGDSITHQMQSKIPLLSRRFERALDYSRFFEHESERKIWAALYAYRSAIAHGGTIDFQSKDRKVLKDADNANAFLREVVKALLRHALKEPQLYRDIREC